jgi:predicted nucleotidyltransferase
VKFIYVRPLKWYLGIEEVKRDLIDDKSDFDMNGWDLRKALQLLKESNCGILEWLTTKHVYRCDEGFLNEARLLATSTHCRRSLLLAYWGKAGKHFREYITIVPEDGTVTLKKYLFVIQALLSARWVFAFSLTGTNLPPQDFSTLLHSFGGTEHALSPAIFDTSFKLMIQKREGTLKTGKRIKDLGSQQFPITPMA